MTPREKKLAVVTGALLLVLAAYFIWGQIDGALHRRRAAITNLDHEIKTKELDAEKSRRAARRLARYRQRSLPADAQSARSMYQNWLLQLVGQAELRDAIVKTVSEHGRGKFYHRLSFTVSGVATLPQLTRLLYDFYQFDHLHQIRRLQVKPIKDSRDLDIVLEIEALRLDKADATDQLADVPNPWLAGQTVDDYIEAIVGRDLFAPPNNPPQLSGVSDKRTERNRPLSFTVQARDADRLDKVTFSLSDDAPGGARIDRTSGRFSWTPTEVGDFRMEVIARDDGLPSKESRQQIRITVVEPTPPADTVVSRPVTPKKLDFDVAKHTYLVGTVEVDGRRQIWLQVRTTGKIHKLHEGDRIQFGSVDGVVARIGDRNVEIMSPDQRLLIDVGENLTAAAVLPPGGI